MKTDEVTTHPGRMGVATGCEAVAATEALCAEVCAVAGAQAPHPAEQAWNRTVAGGGMNAWGDPLRRLEPGTASGVIAALQGAVLTGLRGVGFLRDETLAGAVGDIRQAVLRHLPMVIHATLAAGGRESGEASSDHLLESLAMAGAPVWIAGDGQEAADLALIARKTSESVLLPVVIVQEGVSAFDLWDQVLLPDEALVRAYLGASDETIASPTPAQGMVFGPTRRRIPLRWTVDDPAWTGAVEGTLSGALALAGQGPFFLDPVAAATTEACESFAELTGRQYGPLGTYQVKGAKVLLVGQGNVIPSLEALADRMRTERKVRVGVVNVRMHRPFPGAELAEVLKGRETVAVLERAGPSLASDPPLLGEVRGAIQKAQENGAAGRSVQPHPGFPVYGRGDNPPPLVSLRFGPGNREPTGADLNAAMEHLLSPPSRAGAGFIWPGLIPGLTETPQREILQQQLHDAFPELKNLAPRSVSREPVSEGSLALRLYGVHPSLTGEGEVMPPGGRLEGLIAEVAQCGVKGWEDSSPAALDRPRMRDVLASWEPLRSNTRPGRVDAVIVTDPRVFAMADPLADLRDGGDVLLWNRLESTMDPFRNWRESLAGELRRRELRVHVCDGQKLEDEPEVMLGEGEGGPEWTLLGALLSLPAMGEGLGLDARGLTRGLKRWAGYGDEMEGGSWGTARLQWLEAGKDTLRHLDSQSLEETAGDEAKGIPVSKASSAVPGEGAGSSQPGALKVRPPHAVPAHDPHRFWVQTGALLARGHEERLGVDPLASHGSLPAATGNFRDLSPTRHRLPRWLPEPCTGCGDCWALCPDGALPSQVNTVGELLQAAADVVEQERGISLGLPRAMRTLEGRVKDALNAALANQDQSVNPVTVLAAAIESTLPALPGSDEERTELRHDMEAMGRVLEALPLARSEMYFDRLEAKGKGAGGWLSIALDPGRCKACGLCLAVCEPQALVWEDEPLAIQAREAGKTGPLVDLEQALRFQERLSGTNRNFIAAGAENGGSESGEGHVGELGALLLDRPTREAMGAGSDGEPGAAERTVLRLFAAVTHTTLQPRVGEFLTKLEDLIARMETHTRLTLAVDATDPTALREAMDSLAQGEFTLGELSARMDKDRNPVDANWLKRVTDILSGLKQLVLQYRGEAPGGESGNGQGIHRADMGMVGAGGGTWQGRWPYHPFPFPWGGGSASQGAAMSLGVFEGHMKRMADDFKIVRLAELELDGDYNEAMHAPFFSRFGWRDFSDEEWALCPPVVLAGDESQLTGEGMAVLSNLWRSGVPLRVLNLARCAPGPAQEGETVPLESRKDDGAPVPAGERGTPPADPVLYALAERNVYVSQGSLAGPGALVEGWRQGLDSRSPALFSVYCGRVAFQGGQEAEAADGALVQARLAVQARAFPGIRYNPAVGALPHECLDLSGNPEPDSPWASHDLHYLDGEGASAETTAPLTFADFAACHPDWQDHFAPIPADAPEDPQTPLDEYLELDAEDRAEAQPFIQAVDGQGKLRRLGLSAVVLRATESRLASWRVLRSLRRDDLVPVDEAAIAEGAREEVANTVWKNLVELAKDDSGLTPERLGELAGASEVGAGEEQEAPHA